MEEAESITELLSMQVKAIVEGRQLVMKLNLFFSDDEQLMGLAKGLDRLLLDKYQALIKEAKVNLSK